MELENYKHEKYASAKKIHKALGQRDKNFNQWIKRVLLNTPFKIDLDFTLFTRKSTGGRPGVDYLLKEQTAISVIMMSGGENAHEIRMQVVEAFQQKKTGVLLNVDQIGALTDMVKAMTLVSIQKNSERKHYDFLNRPKNWYTYRAELLGYSAKSLKDAMIEVNKKYRNQKQALINLDPAEIIRTGVVDLLIALGRGREYALNIAEFAKVIAEKNGYHLQIWNDLKPNPLGINKKEIGERKKLLP